MSHLIRIAGAEIAFPCDPAETILDAAERGGFTIPYSCRKGVCASCEGVLAAGRVILDRTREAVDGPAAGLRLCQARPCGDVVIAPVSIVNAGQVRRRFAATVRRIERPAAGVAILALRLPIGRRVRFRAGQYVRIMLADGDSRSYSLANPPQHDDRVELHVRQVPGGCFSATRVAALKPGDKVDLETPYGTSCPPDGPAPLILLATGTGFAPVQSIVEDLARRGVARPVHLFWGGRTMADLYAAERIARWRARHAWFRFTPVLSGAAGGGRGRIQEAALAQYPDMSGCVCHACGNPAMVAAARQLLTTRAGLPAAQYFADAFLPSGAAGS